MIYHTSTFSLIFLYLVLTRYTFVHSITDKQYIITAWAVSISYS